MNGNDQNAVTFLLQLHKLTGGDTEQQISMYEVGEQLGMERAETSTLSEQLMIDELVELKTLSGAIGITRDGLALLEKEGLITPSRPAANAATLSGAPILTVNDREVIEQLLNGIRKLIFSGDTDYESMEGLIIDIKTIETYLLSSRAQSVVVRTLFLSVHDNLIRIGAPEAAAPIKGMID